MVPEPIHVGSFLATSGLFIVADPCNSKVNWREKDALSQGVISLVESCKLGQWEAFLSVGEVSFGYYGERVAREYCWSLSVLHGEISKHVKWVLEAEVLADSGQIGIFDAEHFGDDAAVSDAPKAIQESFYGACCYLTFDETNTEKRYGGCLDFGAVGLSGYGDGRYPINIGWEDQLVVGVNVPFILPEDCELLV